MIKLPLPKMNPKKKYSISYMHFKNKLNCYILKFFNLNCLVNIKNGEE
jgi:hypothetical protein